MIRQGIRSTGIVPVMAQRHNDVGNLDEDFLDYVLEELTEQHDYSFNRLRSCVAATEARMRFSAVLPIGGPAITGSSQPVPSSNSNSNDITNISSVENTGLIDEIMIVEGAMSPGG